MSTTTPPSPAAPSVLADLCGTVLESRYRLERILGAGGMGAVFEATQIKLERKVAIKVLRPALVGHEDFIKRFLREAKSASKIEHRNVVEILEHGETAGGLVYLVMKFLHGRDLEQILRAQPNQRLPWAQACGLLVQVTAGLRAAHANGVIHRDIKPANCVLIEEDGALVVKIVDFGIAKVEEGDKAKELTRTSEVLGTPAYVAPELLLTKNAVGPRSDIYSLGVLAYRMLTGRVPFTGETAFDVLHRSWTEPVPPLRNHVPDLPPAVEAFVLQLMAKDPKQRPPDMHAVREALVVLGRETLEHPSLELSGSGALALDPSPSGRGSGPNDTTPWSPSGSAFRDISSPLAHAPTEVLQTPSSGSSSGLAIPPTLVVSVPATAPTTRVPTPTSNLHPRRNLRTWLAAGGLLSTVASGAVAVGLWLGAAPNDALRRSTGPAQAELAVRSIEPPSTPKPHPAPPEAPRREPELAPAPAPATIPEPEPEPEPAPPIEPQTEPQPTPAPRTPSKPTHPPTRLPGDRPKPKPLADGTVLKKLRRDIQSACASLTEGNELEVSFRIKPSGEPDLVVASCDRVAAEECATARVKSARFAPRPEPTLVTFTEK